MVVLVDFAIAGCGGGECCAGKFGRATRRWFEDGYCFRCAADVACGFGPSYSSEAWSCL